VTIPDAITNYLEAQDRGDDPAVLATLAPDATITDDGHRFDGHDEIGAWLAGAANEYKYTRTLVSADAAGEGTWRIVNHIEGNFPGGQVDLTYTFRLADGRIAELTIAP
jgi:ketosteroid isomerase-like protein